VTASTPDQAERLALIRKALPPIFDTPDGTHEMWTSLVCIDLEWHRASNCPCGVPTRAVGMLETIGIGNEKGIVQIDWPTREFDHEWLRKWLVGVIGALPVVFQNADGDIRKLRENGFPIWAESFKQLDDTMLAHAVLESELPHDLEFLTLKHGHLPQHKDLARVAPAEYNAADVLETVLIWRHYILPFLAKDPQAEYIYRRMSLPFLWLAIESEEAGIRVHPTKPLELFAKFDRKRDDAARLMQAYCGWPVNLNSPDQIQHVLYNLEGMPVQYAKGTGQWGEEGKVTSDKEALSSLRRLQGTEWDPDVPPTLEQAFANIEEGGNPALEARYLHIGAQQAISHYIEPCLAYRDVDEFEASVRERIYPECRIHVQASGRVGYVGPALPQMKGELLDQLLPDVGTCWVGHDWKQIEVRILAAEANDQVYLDIFARGGDIHEENVRAIFGPKGSPELEAIRRRWIKAYVFRLHYRGKPENAADIPDTKALGLNADGLVAASLRYLAAHPALPPYWAAVEAEADRTSCIRTFRGRPRRLSSDNRNARNREASNQPMQGGVADIYIETALLVKKAAPWARLVFGAYDSHWWRVPVERRFEFILIYAPIVEREFVINGRRIAFPADYKFREAA
jgi:DNA polymerase I-like protein with 3'-5' exonuclease and polymerase domains